MRKNDNLEQILRECEDRIARRECEEAHLFDKRGNLISQTQGNDCFVFFPDGLKRQMPNKTLTHNHSFSRVREQWGFRNKSVFSSADLELAYGYWLTQIRLAIGNERHSFKWHIASRFLIGIHSVIIGSIRVFEAAHKNAHEKLDNEYREHTAGEYLQKAYSLDERYFGKIVAFLQENRRWYSYDCREEVIQSVS